MGSTNWKWWMRKKTRGCKAEWIGRGGSGKELGEMSNYEQNSRRTNKMLLSLSHIIVTTMISCPAWAVSEAQRISSTRNVLAGELGPAAKLENSVPNWLRDRNRWNFPRSPMILCSQCIGVFHKRSRRNAECWLLVKNSQFQSLAPHPDLGEADLWPCSPLVAQLWMTFFHSTQQPHPTACWFLPWDSILLIPDPW